MREAAARAQCQSNLKQIGFALHYYHDTYKRLPTGTVPVCCYTPEQRLSWMASILPFVESSPVPSQISWSDRWDAEVNRGPVSTRIPIYQCPAHPGFEDGPNHTHYVGLAGVGDDAAELATGDPRAGAFGYDRRVTFRGFERGTSFTAMATLGLTERQVWRRK